MGESALLQAICDGFPGPAFALSQDGVFLCANAAAEQAFACALPGRGLRDLLPCALGRQVAGAIAAGQGARFHTRLDGLDGTAQQSEVALWPLPLAGGLPAPPETVWLMVMLQEAPTPVACADGSGLTLGRIACSAAAARIEAEAARQKAHEKAEMLRVATENSNVVPWCRLPETGSGRIGPHFGRMLGYPPAFEIDLEVLDGLVHPEDNASVSAEFWAMDRGEIDSYCHDFRVRRADGGWAWITARGRRVARPDGGLPAMICGSLTDISERKQHEARLADALAAAQAARTAAQTNAETLTTALICGEIVVWSICAALGEAWMPDECFRQLGYEPGDFVPDDAGWRSLIHPDDLAFASGRMDDLIFDRAEVFVADHRLRHKDGSYHWYHTVARKIDRSDRGLPFLVSGALSCIDHVKADARRLAAATAQTEQARVRLNTLADNAPGALFEYRLTPDGHIDLPYLSAKLPDMLGVTRAEIEADGAAVFRHVPTELVPYLRRQIETSRDEGSRFDARFPVDHPTAGRRWLAVSSLPFAQSDASTVWFGTVFDISEHVETETRAMAAAEEVRHAHDRLATLADNVPGALLEWQGLPDGRTHFNFFSTSLPDLFGLTREALEQDGTVVYTHVLPEDTGALRSVIARAQEVPARFETRFRLAHPARGLCWISLSASPFRRGDGEVVWYGYALDITARIMAKQQAADATQEVHRAHERLASIASIAPVGLYEFKRFPDGRATLPYSSPYFEDLLGVPCGVFCRDGLAEDVFSCVHPDDLPEYLVRKATGGRQVAIWNQRFRVNHPRRGEIWLSNSATPKLLPDGAVVWTGAVHDVTPDVRREAELRRAHQLAEEMRSENERQALHDGLTGLPNRRYYDQVLGRRIAAAGAAPRDATLVRIDLDHFKHVNDTLGHAAGDMVLQRVAEVLRSALRGTDFVARIGGDEFSILMGPGATRAEAGEMIERIQTRLADPLMFEGRQCRFGASFGIAMTEDLASVGAELQLFADAALYRAKQGGRNRLEFFTPELHRNLLFDRVLAGEIQEGLDRGEFVPFFQPQVGALDGRLTGVETLLRWRHPVRGLLRPDDFMHVAAQLRLVPDIDGLMMEKSREALAFWRAQGVFVPKISFNVSSGRMHDPDVVRAARAMADGATRVTFELLESILVEEESEVFRFHLDAIRDAGIDIEIDDFGSGHASIIGLMQIAPSALKIDRRIVEPVARDIRARNLVRAIVEIAETLGIGTVAEGVETEAQADILRSLRCDILQGYLYSVPLSAEDFVHYGTAARRYA